MYYPCSENKGADQLRGYRGSASLFLPMQIVGFLTHRLKFSFTESHVLPKFLTINSPIFSHLRANTR